MKAYPRSSVGAPSELADDEPSLRVTVPELASDSGAQSGGYVAGLQCAAAIPHAHSVGVVGVVGSGRRMTGEPALKLAS